MLTDLKSLDLESIRNLFLNETKAYFSAQDYETADELKLRMERIKELEKILEEKKKNYLSTPETPRF